MKFLFIATETIKFSRYDVIQTIPIFKNQESETHSNVPKIWLITHVWGVLTGDYETPFLQTLQDFCGLIVSPFLCNESVLHLMNRLPYLKR